MFQLTYVDFSTRNATPAAIKKLPRILTTINHEAGNPDIAMLLAQYDYNQALLNSAREKSKINLSKPNFAGVFLVDPFIYFPQYLDQLSSIGIKGISNYPSVAFYGEAFSNQLDEVNLGLSREIERLAEAREAGFEVLPCLPESADEELTRMTSELLNPSKWLIHNGLQISQSGIASKPKAPNPNIEQLQGELFYYQRYADLSNLPPTYDGIAKVSWWYMQT